MKSVFLIKSPLQLLNALEARFYFDLSIDECVLIIMSDRKSQPQILKLVCDLEPWAEVILLEDVNLLSSNIFNVDKAAVSTGVDLFLQRSFFYTYRLNKVSKYLGGADYIFIGYERSEYMRHFINITQHNMAVLLDDGVVTIDIARERNEGSDNVKNIAFSKKIRLSLKRYFQGLKDYKIDSLCFFTAYNIKAGAKDKVIKNSYKYLRDAAGRAAEIDLVYFIGAPLSEAGILDQSKYFEYLKKVRDYFKGKNLVYIAHRRESKGHLNEIEEKLGFNVKSFGYPIEYQIIKYGPKPNVIASFVSSALDSCRLILGDDIKIISFRLVKGTYSREDSVDMVYEYFSTNISKNFNIESLG